MQTILTREVVAPLILREPQDEREGSWVVKGMFIRVEGKQDTAEEKIRRLNEAGISVAEEIAQIPELVKERLVIED